MENLFARFGVLNGTVLKWIAVISMTIDHIGYIYFPQYIWLRWLGRQAFPIFAYMIAEGCYYTKNKQRYLIMVAGIGVLCQAAMYIAERSLELNIMFTFMFSIALIFSLQWALGKKDVFGKEKGKPSAAGWVVFVLLLAVCAFLDFGLTKIVKGFHIDYGFFGILLAVVIYLFPKKWQKLIAAAICMIVLCQVRGIPTQWWCLFALIPLLLYSGKPGKHRMKYFFYLYYPVHLGILWGIFYLTR